MAEILFFGDSISEEIREAAAFFEEAGHHVFVSSDNGVVDDYLSKQCPDIIVCREWMPQRDIQLVIKMYEQMQPANRTRKVLITSVGATGVPSRYWPNLFDAYVMNGSGTWQIIICVEQFLYRNVYRL